MNPTPDHDDLPGEIDFSAGTRGKFYRPDARLRLPIHLEADVQERLTSIAIAKDVELSELVNDLLKRDLELIEMGR